MDNLLKKLEDIRDLLKGTKPDKRQGMLSPKAPKAPSMASIKPPKPQKPSMKPSSKKSPTAVAEQMENVDLKAQAMKDAEKNKNKLNVDRNGQWEIKTN